MIPLGERLIFRATDVYPYYKPSRCAKRIALIARGVPTEAVDDPFGKLLIDLGLRHEAAHRATLLGVVDLSSKELSSTQRECLTRKAIEDGAPAIYQAGFSATFPLDGEVCEVVGEPDFLIGSQDREGYVIRDSKLARKPLSSDHANIPRHLQIYGFLYENALGVPPAGLEVHAGTGEIIPLPYEGRDAVLELLRDFRRMRAADQDAYEPVGSSKCDGCGYGELCWRAAEAAQDVAILPPVNQDLARKLHARGVATLPQLAAVRSGTSRHWYLPGVCDTQRRSSPCYWLRG
jgi:predicted RecB family nuclease